MIASVSLNAFNVNRLSKFYICAIFFLCLGQLQGSPLLLNEMQEVYYLQNYLYLADPATSIDSWEDLEMPDSSINFQPLTGWQNQLLAHQTYWGKLELKNNLPNGHQYTEWIFKFPLILTHVEVYMKDKMGKIQEAHCGFFMPVSQREFAPTIKDNLVKLNLPPQEVITIYFKMKSERLGSTPDLNIELTHSTTFFIQLKNKKQRNALFLGFVLMMLIYNLFLYSYAKDGAYLYYSIYLLTISSFTAYNTGDLSDWLSLIFPLDTPQNIAFFKPMTYISLMIYAAFIRSFLTLNKLLPFWDAIFKILSYIAIPLLILDLSLIARSNFNYDIADIVTIGYILLFLLTIFIFIFPLYRTGDKKGYFIVAGILVMGLGIFLALLDRIQTVDYSTFYFKIGTILEIIIFSLGLAYRQREITAAKQQADFALEKSQLLQIQEHKEAERLKELNDLKSRLYTNITHEFRTPLTVIMGMTEQLAEKNWKALVSFREEEDISKGFSLIRRNSKNLLSLINQLLDYSKLESGNLELNLKQGDIIGFLRYLTESFYSMATEKKVRLTFYTEIEVLKMAFDEIKVQHMVYNLLFNAIKFTNEKGKVILHVRKEEKDGQEFLQMKIVDTGVGISKNDLPHIFERFYQVLETEKQEAVGTGIGLAFTKELTELMGGQISVKSKVGVGTEFLILLPINISDAPMVSGVSINSNLVDEPLSLTTSKIQTSAPLLLLIEDNLDVITYIKACLEKDYQIQTAHNGQRGIEKAVEIIPDIIISDVRMPEKDGFEVCETLKKDERTSHIPIILLTAKVATKDKITGLKVGADAYITKPFNKEELLVRLEKLVFLRKQLQERYAQEILPKRIKSPENLEDAFLQKLQESIEANLNNAGLTIADLCRIMQMSQVQIYRKLKALTKKTPTQFIRTIRLQYAMKLLKTTNLNVSEVAYKVGFNDPNYFSRLFNQKYGSPPSMIQK